VPLETGGGDCTLGPVEEPYVGMGAGAGAVDETEEIIGFTSTAGDSCLSCVGGATVGGGVFSLAEVFTSSGVEVAGSGSSLTANSLSSAP